MRRAWRIGVGVVTVATLSRTAGAAPTSKLTYVRGPGAEACPDEADLRKEVAARMGYDPFFPFAERTIIAQIDRGDAGFKGQIRIVDANGRLLGERALATSPASCRELVRSVALVISIAIDDLDAANPPDHEAPSAAAAEPVAPAPTPLAARAVQEPEGKRAPAAESAAASSVQLRTTLGGLAALGSAPATAIGATLGGGVTSKWWSLGVEGRALFPADTTLSRGGRVETSLVTAAIVPCARLQTSPAPYACALASIGSLHAKADEVSKPSEASALYAALGGRLGIEIAFVEWLAAYGQVDVGATMTRHRLELNGSTVYELPAVWASFGAGLAARFF